MFWFRRWCEVTDRKILKELSNRREDSILKKANLMTRQLEAIFQDGVLRPLQPLSLLEDQKVLVTITIVPTDLAESDYLDTELHRYCEARADSSITLEQVRKELAAIHGSIADDLIIVREERF